MVTAWYYNETEEDPREAHHCEPNEEVSVDELSKLGVLQWSLIPKLTWTRHIHEDEEIRYILAGSGYFDIRNKADRWPAGSYHRFILDSTNYIKAMRLFKEVWNRSQVTPINRSKETDVNTHRVGTFLPSLACALKPVPSDSVVKGLASTISDVEKVAVAKVMDL
ncbi:hypothetical protein BSLG_001156 [Batrachochytrium salamandrivorans]|nr:hypothetical protein BSLG_001156 [Batrachochytrium salamandrivorans]